MSFTLILTEVLDFFQPLKYSINHNVFKIKVKCYFLIKSKKRALLFFLRSLDLEKALLWKGGDPEENISSKGKGFWLLIIRTWYYNPCQIDKPHRHNQNLVVTFLGRSLVSSTKRKTAVIGLGSIKTSLIRAYWLNI